MLMPVPFKDITGRFIQPGDIVAYAVGTEKPILSIAKVIEYVEKVEAIYDSNSNAYKNTTVTKIKLQYPSKIWNYAVRGNVKTSVTTYFTDKPKRFIIVTGIHHDPLAGWNVGEPV